MSPGPFSFIIALLVVASFSGIAQQAQPFPPYEMHYDVYEFGEWLFSAPQELRYSRPETFWVTGDGRVDFRSGTRVRIDGRFRAEGLTANGRFRAYIGPEPFEVAVMVGPGQDGSVPRNSRFEIGIRPSDDIMTRIQAFIDYDQGTFQSDYLHYGWNSTNGLNPFLSWDIRVKAEFRLLDMFNNTVSVKKAEGFYYKPFAYVDTDNDGLAEHYDVTLEDQHPFRVRTIFPDVGRWSCHFSIILGEGSATEQVMESSPYIIQVTESGLHGPVKVAANGRFLEMDGQPFFPVGRNMQAGNCDTGPNYQCSSDAIYSWNQRGMKDNPRGFQISRQMIKEQRDEGSRHFRMVSAPSNLDIEFERLGNYYDRLRYAWEMDKLLDLVHGVDGAPEMFMEWVMFMGVELDHKAPFYHYNWDWVADNKCGAPGFPDVAYCYNAMLNLSGPEDFLTDTEAIRYFKEKLRYLMARYGHSTNIYSFDLWSEIDGFGTDRVDDAIDGVCKEHHAIRRSPYAGYRREFEVVQEEVDGVTTKFWRPVSEHIDNGKIYDFSPSAPAAGAWQAEMARYIKQDLGYSNALIGVSYAEMGYIPTGGQQGNHLGDEAAFYSPHIDVITFNNYTHRPDKYGNVYANVVAGIHQNLTLRTGKPKPVIIGEVGEGNEMFSDCDLLEWKKAVVVSCFTGLAGAAQHWQHQGLHGASHRPELSYFQGYMNSFMQQIDLVNETWVADASEGTGSDRRVELLYLRRADGTRATGVLNNRTANFHTMGDPLDEEGQQSACAGFVANEWVLLGMSNLDEPQSVQELSSGGLLFKGLMPNTLYKLRYYNPYDTGSGPGSPSFDDPTPVVTDGSGQLLLTQFPELNPETSPFLLIEVIELQLVLNGKMEGPDDEVEEMAIRGDHQLSLSADGTPTRLSVGPNPFTDMLSVHLAGASDLPVSMKLTDASGREVLIGLPAVLHAGGNPIETGHLAKGIYLLQIHSAPSGHQHYFKIIRQ